MGLEPTVTVVSKPFGLPSYLYTPLPVFPFFRRRYTNFPITVIVYFGLY